MKTIVLSTSLVVTLLASCTNKTNNTETLVPVPYDNGVGSFGAKSGLGGYEPKGKWLSRGTANVLHPEQVEAYPIARYQDPSNPNVMHERHFVYRKQAQKWNLTPNTSEQVNLGNVPERSRILDGRIAEKVSDVAVRDAVITQRDALRQQQASLGQQAQNAANLSVLEANQKKLAQTMKTLSDRQKQTLEAIANERALNKSGGAVPDPIQQSGDKDFYKE